MTVSIVPVTGLPGLAEIACSVCGGEVVASAALPAERLAAAARFHEDECAGALPARPVPPLCRLCHIGKPEAGDAFCDACLTGLSVIS